MIRLRQLAQRLSYLRSLKERKEEVSRLLSEMDKLTPAIQQQLQAAVTLQEVEDIYRRSGPSGATRATVAREQGLEPLAEMILAPRTAAPTSSPGYLCQSGPRCS